MAIDFTFPPEIDEVRFKVRDFLDTVVRPIEAKAEADDWARDEWVRAIIDMRTAAHEWGLWLPHMPKEWGGMGLGHVAMASVSAEAGKTRMGPFASNAQAPDEGNMHTLLHWATDQQKEDYLRPLCDGFKMVDGKPRSFRSCFAMTEPEVAGSDPTLIQTRAFPDGDTWVINGHKWFITGRPGRQLRHPDRPYRGRPRPSAGGQLRVPRRHPVRGLGGRARRRDDGGQPQPLRDPHHRPGRAQGQDAR